MTMLSSVRRRRGASQAAKSPPADAEDSRERTDKSFFVPKQEIIDNDYDLSINKYKKTEYTPVEYPSTAEIMTDLHKLEMQITAGLAELEGMLE